MANKTPNYVVEFSITATDPTTGDDDHYSQFCELTARNDEEAQCFAGILAAGLRGGESDRRVEVTAVRPLAA